MDLGSCGEKLREWAALEELEAMLIAGLAGQGGDCSGKLNKALPRRTLPHFPL